MYPLTRTPTPTHMDPPPKTLTYPPLDPSTRPLTTPPSIFINKKASPHVASPVDPDVSLIAPPLPLYGDVFDPALIVTATPTTLAPEKTDTVMVPPVPYTSDTVDKLILQLLPADASPVIIVAI